MRSEPPEILRKARTAVLLRSFASLTHRLHEARQAPVTAARTRGEYEDDLLTQRNLIRDEILRRTGDL